MDKDHGFCLATQESLQELSELKVAEVHILFWGIMSKGCRSGLNTQGMLQQLNVPGVG